MSSVPQLAGDYVLAFKVQPFFAESPGLDQTIQTINRLLSFCGNKLRGLHTSDVGRKRLSCGVVKRCKGNPMSTGTRRKKEQRVLRVRERLLKIIQTN